MADLLGSILGSMEKPPSLGDAEKKRAKQHKALMEKQQECEKKKLEDFRVKMQKRIHDFMKDGNKQKYQFEPMDKVYRAIVHEVADVAGLTAFSFGQEETDRYVMLWKKEFAPSDDELLAYRRGEEWDPEKAKELAKEKLEELSGSRNVAVIVPSSNYKDKYRHLIGEDSAKDAAKQTTANKSYGFVPSENKRDKRTIEQVLADSRARKKLKSDLSETGNQATGSEAEELSSLTTSGSSS